MRMGLAVSPSTPRLRRTPPAATSSAMRIAHLPERGVVAVHGPDAAAFLQGLVSNDVAAIPAGEARFAALLTPQGKWLADFFVFPSPEGLLLECERAQAPLLLRLLARYRLRAKVSLADASDSFAVHAASGRGYGGRGAADPRHRRRRRSRRPRSPPAGRRLAAAAACPAAGGGDGRSL